MTEETHDSVNHPAHYTSDPSGVECIEITRHRTFNVGNAIKYLWRAGLKDEDTTVEDLQKAIWYIQDEIKRISPPEPEPLLGVVTPNTVRVYNGFGSYITSYPANDVSVTYVNNYKKNDDGDDGEAQAVPC